MANTWSSPDPQLSGGAWAPCASGLVGKGSTRAIFDTSEPHDRLRVRVVIESVGALVAEPQLTFDDTMPHCDACTDIPTANMREHGRTCSWAFGLENHCRRDAFWRANRFCERSCFLAGAGYDRVCLACDESRVGEGESEAWSCAREIGPVRSQVLQAEWPHALAHASVQVEMDARAWRVASAQTWIRRAQSRATLRGAAASSPLALRSREPGRLLIGAAVLSKSLGTSADCGPDPVDAGCVAYRATRAAEGGRTRGPALGRSPRPLRALSATAFVTHGGHVAATWRIERRLRSPRLAVRAHYDAVTADNGCKMAWTQPTMGRFDWTGCDGVFDWAASHGQAVRGHTLVWHQDNPAWLEAELLAGRGERALLSHVAAVVGRYGGRAYAWDVVNEPIGVGEDGAGGRRGWGARPSAWAQARLGGHAFGYVEAALRAARAASPQPLLFVNEYLRLEVNSDKADALLALLEWLRLRGAPIDGVGLQLHLSSAFAAVDALETLVARIAELGLQVHMTEVDVRAPPGIGAEEHEKRQAALFAALLDVCLGHDACTAFTSWGFTDAHSWRGPDARALPFDTRYRPKLAVAAMADTLRGDSTWALRYYDTHGIAAPARIRQRDVRPPSPSTLAPRTPLAPWPPMLAPTARPAPAPPSTPVPTMPRPVEAAAAGPPSKGAIATPAAMVTPAAAAVAAAPSASLPPPGSRPPVPTGSPRADGSIPAWLLPATISALLLLVVAACVHTRRRRARWARLASLSLYEQGEEEQGRREGVATSPAAGQAEPPAVHYEL